MAALRTLTLPYGATSGGRIVLDGITGTIKLYDPNNVLILVLDPTSGFPSSSDQNFVLFDTNGFPVITMDSSVGAGLRVYEPPSLLAHMIMSSDALTMRTGLPGHQVAIAPGGIQMAGFPLSNDVVRMKMYTGYPTDIAVLGSAELHLYSGKSDFSQPPFMQPVFQDLNAAYTRPRIDLTGPGGAVGTQEARTVVNDLWQGTPQGAGLLPVEVSSYPRGARTIWKFEKTTDTVLSTVNGTYTSIITTGNLALQAGRLYQITAIPGTYLLTGGSGWVVGDTWRIRIYRSIGGAAAATMRRSQALRSNVAAGAVINVAPMIGWFSPAVDSNVSFIYEAAKTAGAATITSSFSVDGGEGYGELVVQDIGAWTAGALH